MNCLSHIRFWYVLGHKSHIWWNLWWVITYVLLGWIITHVLLWCKFDIFMWKCYIQCLIQIWICFSNPYIFLMNIWKFNFSLFSSWNYSWFLKLTLNLINNWFSFGFSSMQNFLTFFNLQSTFDSILIFNIRLPNWIQFHIRSI